LKPTSRTFGFRLKTRMVSPSMTRTSAGSIGAAPAWCGAACDREREHETERRSHSAIGAPRNSCDHPRGHFARSSTNTKRCCDRRNISACVTGGWFSTASKVEHHRPSIAALDMAPARRARAGRLRGLAPSLPIPRRRPVRGAAVRLLACGDPTAGDASRARSAAGIAQGVGYIHWPAPPQRGLLASRDRGRLDPTGREPARYRTERRCERAGFPWPAGRVR
jgi:hypothetical protein